MLVGPPPPLNPVLLTVIGSAWVASQDFGPLPAGDYYIELKGEVLATASPPVVGTTAFPAIQTTTVSPAISVSVTGTAIPELSTWRMMGLGFAGLAFAGYRSRRSAVSIA